MFAPNIQTYDLANARHSERLDHAARMHTFSIARRPQAEPVTHDAQRRITVRRLTAAATALALSVGAAAAALGA